MITTSEFAKRRKQIMKKIGPTGIAILAAAPVATRNGDCDYPYRQNSDFYYVTGFEEPEAVAIIAPNRKEGQFILFNRIRNRAEEIWTGFRAGQEGAKKEFKADEAYPIHELTKKLPELLEGREEIYYTLGMDAAFDKTLLGAINRVRGKIRSGIYSPIAFKDITDTIHEMRLIKSPAEIQLMRKAADISAGAHIRAMQICKPGMNEYQLEAEMTYEFQRNGARFLAYNSIVGSGGNSCILHYNDNNKVIPGNSVVLIDAGCEYQYYASDITRTFPANGRFSPEQKAIYDIVLAAQLAGIKAVRPGALWPAAQTAIIKVITQGLLDLGILKGKLNTLIENEAYFPFYMHKSGHWLGIDVHDAGRYKINGKWRQLQPGMVLTVEPGIYISPDITGVDKRWHHIGIRIEDDILVTTKGNEILSHRVPKNTDEIEALMRA
jgi:Xaa-Pro aminopeptidase